MTDARITDAAKAAFVAAAGDYLDDEPDEVPCDHPCDVALCAAGRLYDCDGHLWTWQEPETTSAQYGHPSAVCVMDWNRCTETFCDLYASGCPHFREDGPRCPRCGRVIATVGDGDPARIMDVTNENAEYAGADLCLRCAEYLDPTDF